MTKVKVLKRYRVAINPRQTVVYEEGNIVDVDDDILKNMIHDGVAEIYEEKSKPAPEENKAVEKAPENKSKKGKK